MAKIVAPSSNKGGVLKTSLSTNLAGVLSQHGKKTLVIDMDNQGNVATTFGMDPDDEEFSIYDLLVKNPDLKDPHDAIMKITDNLDIIVANDDMAFFEIDVLTELKKYPNYFSLLSDVVKIFNDEYDFIVIDTPPQMGLVAANIFNAVEDIIIPYQPEEYAFRSLVKTVNAIFKFKKTNTKLTINEVVPVKVKRTLMHRAYLDSAKAYTKQNKIKFSSYQIKDSIKYAEMVARRNIPLSMFDTLPKDVEQYKKIYEDLAKEMGYIG